MIRLAKKSDVPALRSLAEVGDAEFSAAPSIFSDGKFDLVLDYLENDAVLVSEDEGVVNGFVCVAVKDGRGMVGDLIVAKEKRGNGVGRMLVEAGHDLAWKRGAKNALVIIWTEKGLEPFYEAVGYRTIGHLMEAPL